LLPKTCKLLLSVIYYNHPSCPILLLSASFRYSKNEPVKSFAIFMHERILHDYAHRTLKTYNFEITAQPINIGMPFTPRGNSYSHHSTFFSLNQYEL